MHIRKLAVACMAVVVLAGSNAFATSSPAKLDITLATTATNGVADGILVTYAYSPALVSDAPLTLELDTLDPGLERSSDVVSDLVASDSHGPLSLGKAVRREQGPRTFDTWTAGRPVSGTLRVSYRMKVAHHKAAKRGPQVDLQAAGGGISGGYVGFLVLPDVAGAAFDTHVRWILRPGETAVSSYGEGDYQGTFTPDKLTGTLFLAGPVMAYRIPGRNAGLEVYGLGVSKEQLSSAGKWAADAYAAEVKAFGLPENRPYRYFIRSYDGGANPSGRAAEHSFLLYVPPGADPGTNVLHFTVAHEMVHSLARYLEREDVDGDWYTEGMANYLALTIPNGAGLYTAAQYLALVQAESAGYYTNGKRSISNDQMAATVWTGRNAWLLPYNRGALYFADLDAKLKVHGAKTSVIDLANEMSSRIEAGEPADRQTWLDVLTKRAGPWAIDDWNHMMSGKTIFPAPGAFGSCMHSHRENVRIFDLGFASPVRLVAGSVIGGLTPGSPAERAGLRNGDVLATGVDINPVAQSLDKRVVLHVRRKQQSMTIAFDPSGGTQSGLAWTSSCLR